MRRLFLLVCILSLSWSAWAANTTTYTIEWQPQTNAVSYEVWSSPNVTKPFTLLTNVGLNTSFSLTYTNGDPNNPKERYFYVRGYFSITNTVNVTLMWDYTCTGTNDVAGYRVYFGDVSQHYTNVVGTGPCTNKFVTVSNLIRLETYFFAATAYDLNGVESDFSNELVYNPPVTYLTNGVLATIKVIKQ